MYDYEEEDVLAIKGELWMCADSEKPYKVGAGRGSKNLIGIEDDRFYVYSTRSTQSRLIKEVAFRSMKRIAWFTHSPKPPTNGGPLGVTPQQQPTRGKRGITSGVAGSSLLPLTPYYYMVVEFIRDNTIEGMENLAKRERVVLCTDDAQDFQLWQQFVETYKSSHDRTEIPELIVGRSKKKKKGHPLDDTHDETTSDDMGDEIARLMNEIQMWKKRALGLIEEASQVVFSPDDKKNISSSGDANDSNWKERVELLINALKNKTDKNPSLDEIPPIDKSSQLLELWNELHDRHLPGNNTQEEVDIYTIEQQQERVKKIDNLLMNVERKISIPNKDIPFKDKTHFAADVEDLEATCLAIVSDYEFKRGKIENKNKIDDNNSTSSSTGDKTKYDKDIRLFQKIEHIYHTLEKQESETNGEDAADGMLAELRAARRALDVAPTGSQSVVQQDRYVKNVERLAKDALLAYSQVTVALLQSCYEEYAFVLDHLLSAVRGSGAGGEKIVITSAHFEVVEALEEEKRAAKVKQEALENLMEELERVQRERDEEIGLLEHNFSRAKEGWENDLAVLQAKLTTLQSSMSRTAVVVPAENTVLVSPREELYGKNEEETPATASTSLMSADTGDFSDNDDSITRWATRLTCSGGELRPSVVALRLQRFFFWSLRNVVPLCAGRDTNCILELVMWAMRNHMELLQTAARVFGSYAVGGENGNNEEKATDLCSALQALHNNHLKLRQLIEQYGDISCDGHANSNADFTNLEDRLSSLRRNDMVLTNVHDILDTDNENVESKILELLQNNETLRHIETVTGVQDNTAAFIRRQYDELNQLKSSLQEVLAQDQIMDATTSNLINLIPTIAKTQEDLETAQRELIQRKEELKLLNQQSNIEEEELNNRLELIYDYINNHPLQQNTRAPVTEEAVASILNINQQDITEKVKQLQNDLNLSNKLLGITEINQKDASPRVNNDTSTRAQCLRGIEAALATLGATDSDEPAAAAILRAAEDAKAREEALQTQLAEAAERASGLETMVAEHAEREERLEVQLAEAAERASGLETMVAEHAEREERLEVQLAEAAERASGLETMVAEHAEREERLEVQLAEAAERASGLETMVAEHAEREERLEVQLAEAAEREGALEAQLTELVNAVVILQNALEGSAPVASSDEDAKTSGCCAVEALQRLKDCADAASTVMSAAMHLEPFDTGAPLAEV
ncbi:hypothetical protein LSM04_003891 [Trypanosoma melophagium]|uniref:uncharacterized protein n=1 Tax=Trypanosoma melophagium TaxID=715481 RepID=UPI00351A7264|nr:hypothetical protein LSM04_003891 [Trypanosoma melophagium]